VKIHLCQVIFHHNDVILSALIITLQGSELIKIVKIEGTVLHKAILTSHGEYSFQGSPKQSFALLTKLTESFFNNPNCSYYKERLQNEISPKKKYIGESLGGIRNTQFCFLPRKLIPLALVCDNGWNIATREPHLSFTVQSSHCEFIT
jgi:hypothetical protein